MRITFVRIVHYHQRNREFSKSQGAPASTAETDPTLCAVTGTEMAEAISVALDALVLVLASLPLLGCQFFFHQTILRAIPCLDFTDLFASKTAAVAGGRGNNGLPGRSSSAAHARASSQSSRARGSWYAQQMKGVLFSFR